MDFRAPGLAAGTFTHWAISLAHKQITGYYSFLRLNLEKKRFLRYQREGNLLPSVPQIHKKKKEPFYFLPDSEPFPGYSGHSQFQPSNPESKGSSKLVTLASEIPIQFEVRLTDFVHPFLLASIMCPGLRTTILF